MTTITLSASNLLDDRWLTAALNDYSAACGAHFVFTSGEQEFYASRGFDNPPSRCPTCRAARKAERSNSFGPTSYASSGGFAAAPRREMFVTTCASCNGEARVPFQPRGDKPVYCSDCFETQRGAGRPAPRGSYR